MKHQDFGWDSFFENHYRDTALDLTPGRITEQFSTVYRIAAAGEFLNGEVSGRFAHTKNRSADFPAVGDWVLFEKVDTGKAIIHHTLPRKSLFSRKESGGNEQQVIAANVDFLCIVTGLDANFNLNRIQRYITLAYDSGAIPLVLLNKADLIESREEILLKMGDTLLSAQTLFLSGRTGNGVEEVKQALKPGKTAAFVGSSGAGKSTIINRLMGEEVLKTAQVRSADGKGRHTTTGRHLMRTPDGLLIMDTPGMRELALWCGEDSVDGSFEEISRLAQYCRFRDCSHETEPGCAVKEALETGELSKARFENYLKMKKEARYLERKQDPAMNANSKKRWKAVHKQVREMKKKGYWD